jgi:membrane AbrB-like protein
MIEIMLDLAFLFFLGICGWAIFTLLRIPVAALLGTIVMVGSLRVLQFNLPFSPSWLSPLVQIFLGLFVGSKITRETVGELRTMLRPALLIVFWTLSIVFLLGFFLSKVTFLDPITSVLSCSMGGLPEMTIIALATNANVTIVIVIQAFRMVVTAALFPFILKFWISNQFQKNNTILPEVESNPSPEKGVAQVLTREERMRTLILSFWDMLPFKPGAWRGFLKAAAESLLSFLIAAVGGFFLYGLGVPAGAMVGSMFFTVAASLMGFYMKPPAPNVFNFMLVGVGLMVSNNITAQSVEVLTSGSLVKPILVSTVLIFSSSFFVAYIIHKMVNWDFPTSFLAAAPGGFTVMVSLAIRYDKDPFRVSMLHLLRLLAIKSVVPFVFMFIS